MAAKHEIYANEGLKKLIFKSSFEAPTTYVAISAQLKGIYHRSIWVHIIFGLIWLKTIFLVLLVWGHLSDLIGSLGSFYYLRLKIKGKSEAI